MLREVGSIQLDCSVHPKRSSSCHKKVHDVREKAEVLNFSAEISDKFRHEARSEHPCRVWRGMVTYVYRLRKSKKLTYRVQICWQMKLCFFKAGVLRCYGFAFHPHERGH